MIVKNRTGSVIRFPSGHIIEPGAQAHISKSVLSHADNRPFIEGMIKSQKIEVGVARKGPLPPRAKTTSRPVREVVFSRGWLAASSEAELRELAEIYGIEFKEKMTQDQMLSIVASAMFVDL